MQIFIINFIYIIYLENTQYSFFLYLMDTKTINTYLRIVF